MLIGLTKDKKVDIYDESEAKEFLNKDYQMHLFPVGTDASLFTRLETCEVLKEFKKAVISYRVTLYDTNEHRYEYSYVNPYIKPSIDFFEDPYKQTTVEITNVVDFIKLLHSLLELNSFNTMFQTKAAYGEHASYIFVLTNFVMKVTYGNTKDTLKIKEKHRKRSSDPLGSIENGDSTALISTVLMAIDDFLGIGILHHKPQLFDCVETKIFINENLTKWDTRDSFKGQTLISESLINSNAVTFINVDIDKIFKRLAKAPSRCGNVKLCQFISMADEDDLPLDGPISIKAINSLGERWFDLHDYMVYPLYTPADYIEAACMAYYMLRASIFQLDLTPEDNIYKSILEIELAPSEYTLSLYESDLEESHEKDSVLKELISLVCNYLKDMHVL